MPTTTTTPSASGAHSMAEIQPSLGPAQASPPPLVNGIIRSIDNTTLAMTKGSHAGPREWRTGGSSNHPPSSLASGEEAASKHLKYELGDGGCTVRKGGCSI